MDFRSNHTSDLPTLSPPFESAEQYSKAVSRGVKIPEGVGVDTPSRQREQFAEQLHPFAGQY